MSTARRSSGRGRRGGNTYVARSYQSDGIVLRTYKLGEADRIIVLLTPQFGQIRAVARGIRRTSSRFGATLEPFMHTRVQIIPAGGSSTAGGDAHGPGGTGRGLQIISQTQLLHPYATMISTDYQAYGAASAMVEIAERLTRAEDPGDAAHHYRLLYGAMAALARRAHPHRAILDSYALRALATAGWSASFTDCAHCGAPGPHEAVNIRLGGAVCQSCRTPGSHTLAPETMRLLAGLRTGDWDPIDHDPDITPSHQRQASTIVAEYLQFHLEFSLHSLAVLDQDATPRSGPAT